MCTRFFIEQNEPIFQPIIKKAKESPLYERLCIKQGHMIETAGEIFPTNAVAVIAPDKYGKPSAYPMLWGMPMADGTPIFNARTETAGIKPFFKEDWLRHRCIVPASWYYEWKHGADGSSRNTIAGQNSLFQPASSTDALEAGKYAIQPEGASVTWLCGLYRIQSGLPYFVILTREPSDELKRIHDRMPLILPQERIKEWIDPKTDPSTIIPYSLTNMVFEKAE